MMKIVVFTWAEPDCLKSYSFQGVLDALLEERDDTDERDFSVRSQHLDT